MKISCYSFVQVVTVRLNYRNKSAYKFVILRRNVKQTDCMMPCVMFFLDKHEMNYFNFFVSILFTLKCQVIPYKLTPLFPDDVECTHLTSLAIHSLQLYDLFHLLACVEA
jgi:hypothetical protein